MATETTDHHFNPDARRDELLERFRSLDPKEARREVAILPYYHQLENEITKPNQGVFVTRYFVTNWRPSLGSEAASIVQALRLLADRDDGTTIAGYDLIASYAGLSRRAVERWLTTNEQAIADRSAAWKRQWQLLHAYFVLDKKRLFRQRTVPTESGGQVSRVQLSTYEIKVAMDDPVHPDHEGKLFLAAAKRIVNDEQTRLSGRNSAEDSTTPFTRPTGGQRSYKQLEADPFTRPTGGFPVTPNGRGRSYSYRSTSNVRETNQLADAIGRLAEPERHRREALADEIGQRLKTLAGDRDSDLHKSAGFHRRIAFLLPEQLVREALTATRDAADDVRAGRRSIHRGFAAYFAGTVRRIAEREGIDLGVEWTAKDAPTTP